MHTTLDHPHPFRSQALRAPKAAAPLPPPRRSGPPRLPAPRVVRIESADLDVILADGRERRGRPYRVISAVDERSRLCLGLRITAEPCPTDPVADLIEEVGSGLPACRAWRRRSPGRSRAALPVGPVECFVVEEGLGDPERLAAACAAVGARLRMRPGRIGDSAETADLAPALLPEG